MPFLQKYTIIPRYLTARTKRRPGIVVAPSVRFIVAHDTGNANSTASGNVKYYKNTENNESSSAHIFVDDKEIVECIPALTASPEKAWHVRYDITKDNELYGFNANDAAIGVEYCFGSAINADEAYKRYLWVIAYTCFKCNLNPQTAIVGHFVLDPNRRSDPVTGLGASGRTYEKLLKDIVTEYANCIQGISPTPPVIPPLPPSPVSPPTPSPTPQPVPAPSPSKISILTHIRDLLARLASFLK
ncbi:MAG: N-acetylmuramoyl-L-alanine amidase CwlA [Parcubacteria group bacterium Gr01-1014_33]|nr:MAG: N-acetylmuramoyl-L-alanine amidase CwlA [Parcubacteria group bacterium Gr01-1014_33]